MSPDASVEHVRLSVADLGAMTAFYCGVLGFRPSPADTDGTVHLSPDGRPPFLMGLTPVPAAPRPPRRSTGLYHSAIRVPGRVWLGRLLRRLAARGIALDGAADHRVSEALYLRDPEGNGLELYADRPRETWPHAAGEIVMTTEPLNLDELMAAGSEHDGAWESLPPGTRVGHVHLRVAALDRAETFYHGVLGFDVTLRAYPGALFFSAGGYHHHVAVNVWGGAGAPPPPGTTGLRSFAVRIPNDGELARITRNAERQGLQIDSPAESGSAVATIRDWDGICVELVVGPDAGDPGQAG